MLSTLLPRLSPRETKVRQKEHVGEGKRGNETDTRVDSTLTKSATADAETRLPRNFHKADEASLSARDTPPERPSLAYKQSVKTPTLEGDTLQCPIPPHATDGRLNQRPVV